MSKEFEEKTGIICPSFSDERPIVGYDSEVYRLGNQVLKIYNRSFKEKGIPVSTETLGLYFSITNAAAEFPPGHLILKFPGMPVYELKVNKIDEIYKCGHCGYITAVSAYVANEHLKEAPREFDPEELRIGLGALSEKINKELGVTGVNLIPLNIKRSGGILIITDLCSDLGDLRRRNY